MRASRGRCVIPPQEHLFAPARPGRRGHRQKRNRGNQSRCCGPLFGGEAAGRERSALATRRAAAGFPTGKTFDAWSPETSSIPAPTQQALRTLEWVHRRENLIACGPSGTGKTFLLKPSASTPSNKVSRSPGHPRGPPPQAVGPPGVLLRRHRADDTVTKAIARVLRADLVVVDLCRHRDYADVIDRWAAAA